MNTIDIFIILLLLLGLVSGFKKGFTHELVSFGGFALVFVLSYITKDFISTFIYRYLPFFEFGNILKGASVLNILVYEAISFFIAFTIFMLLFKLVLKLTKVFEKLLNATIILGIPSKILGAIVGVIEFYVITFIFLYILALPICIPDFVSKSKFGPTILNDTPILNNLSKSIIEISNDFLEVKDSFKNESDINEFNLETLDTMLEYKVVSKENVQILINRDKLNIKDIEKVLKKY